MLPVLAIVVASLTAAPPPGLGCLLATEGQTELGGAVVEKNGWKGSAQDRHSYTLTRGGESVKTFGWGKSKLASLTWRPKTGSAATFTCTTTKAGGDTEPERGIYGVLCLVDDQHLVSALGTAIFERDGLRYSAAITGYELRMAIQDGPTSFVGAWAHLLDEAGGGRTLVAGGRSLTCWRL